MIEPSTNQSRQAAVATPTGAESAREAKHCSYVLMSAAHNEEADIERTIQSVLATNARDSATMSGTEGAPRHTWSAPGISR